MQVEYKEARRGPPPRLKGEKGVPLWMVLSVMIALGTALGAPGNFGDTPGLNGAEMQNSKGINPVQHSE